MTPRILVLVASIIGSALGADSAQAAVAAVQRSFADTAVDSLPSKGATATCVGGRQLVGTGGGVFTAADVGAVVLRAVRPDATLTSVRVEGQEDEGGFAGNWIAVAHGVCAVPPPGLERRSATSAKDSANGKTATATCPAGKRVIGTGGQVTGGGGQVGLDDVRPNPGLTSVIVQGLEDADGTAANWSVTAFAICAKAVAGLQRVAVATPSDSQPGKTLTAACPPGRHVLGAGADVAGGTGRALLSFNIPDELSEQTSQAAESEAGTTSNWQLRAYAICAATVKRELNISPENSSSKAVQATCDGGRELTGGGGDLAGLDGAVRLMFTPTAAGMIVAAQEILPGIASDWRVRAFSICASPLPGLEFVSNTSPASSTDKNTTVTCPAGKKVVGAGGSAGAPNVVQVNAITPLPGLTGVQASAFEDENGATGDWTVTAYAVCATPPAGLQLITAQGDVHSDPQSAVAVCPPGKVLLGAGGEVQGPATTGGEIVIDDLRPNELLTAVVVTGLEHPSGTTSVWFPRAHAICANP